MESEGRRIVSGGLTEYGSAKLEHPGNSAWLTAGIIIADVVGAGILSMGVSIAKFGWLLGSVMTLFMLALNMHVSIVLWRVKRRFPDAHTYVEVAVAAFTGQSPEQQRVMYGVTATAQYILIGGFLGVYTFSLGKSLGMLFYDWHLCLPVWTFLGCLVTLPFVATARKLGTWRSLIYLNCLTILATVFIPLGVMAAQGVEKSRIPGAEVHAIADPEIGYWMTGLSIMMFSFSGQFMIVEIMSEMKDIEEFPTAYVWMSGPFQAFVFLACGLGAYYYQGDKINGMIIDNIPFGIWFRIASACLIVHMIITWVFKGIVLCRGIQDFSCPHLKESDSRWGWTVWVMLVTTTMFVSWLVANIVPFFVDLVDIIGAGVSPFTCFILPYWCYSRWLSDFGKDEDRVGWYEWILAFIEVTLAVIITFVGTYFAVTNIIAHWETFGYPFACHCQGIWNTCKCSASHPGMEHCETQGSFFLRLPF
jgi:amino acid permease